MIPALVAAIAGLISAGVGTYTAIKASNEKKKAQAAFDAAMKNRTNYQPTEASKQALIESESQKNALSPAVLMAYQQALAQTAAQQNLIQKNATSGAEALSSSSAAQNSFQNLLPQLMGAQQSYQDKKQANYYNALGDMSRQQEMVQEDKNAKQSDLINYYLGRMGAANTNKTQGIAMAAQGASNVANSTVQYDPNSGKYVWAYQN